MRVATAAMFAMLVAPIVAIGGTCNNNFECCMTCDQLGNLKPGPSGRTCDIYCDIRDVRESVSKCCKQP
ncbi:hypothetical protein CGMCC3_g14979 [Colletotrichum fructicola]|nr:uncharacterized protein CGMCC3_g14979 [Colletotrichum fructicola]KAE9568973.1 hypothetical protein CGMCC3_g14979 [Colletotrichum fructicola]KAF5493651.1 hypothetical protein CGCF413_v009413 [Colletotrichum fructicola]